MANIKSLALTDDACVAISGMEYKIPPFIRAIQYGIKLGRDLVADRFGHSVDILRNCAKHVVTYYK
jgi:hypothetical protein